LNANSHFVLLAKEGNRADATRRHTVQHGSPPVRYAAPHCDESAYERAVRSKLADFEQRRDIDQLSG